MPQRTFTALDINSFNINTIQDPGNSIDWVVSGSAFNNILVSVTHADSASGFNNIAIISIVSVNATGVFNFQNFPAVPVGALITNVKLSFEASASGVAAGSGDAPTETLAEIICSFGESLVNPFPYDSLSISAQDNQFFANSSVAPSDSKSLVTSLLEYNFADITLEEFTLLFENLDFTIFGQTQAYSNSFAPSNKNVSYQVNIAITALQLVVTYTDPPSVEWTVETPSPVTIGDEVVIIGDDADEITEITITLPLPGGDETFPAEIIEQNPGSVTIVIPSGLGDFSDNSPINISITITTFSGSVTLTAILQLVFLDASGIYVLTPNKTSDTIYDRSLSTVLRTVTEIVPAEYIIDELIDKEDEINLFHQSLSFVELMIPPEFDIDEELQNPYMLFKQENEIISIGNREVKIPNPFARTGYIGG